MNFLVIGTNRQVLHSPDQVTMQNLPLLDKFLLVIRQACEQWFQ
jgi:hypothetical protein